MTIDLIELVQPTEGWFVILGLHKTKYPKQKNVATREEFDKLSEQYLTEGRDVYFGVARYTSEDGGRVNANVKSVKAFWLDIDCGPKKAEIDPETGRPKGYIDQDTGLVALQEFSTLVGLPKPTIVNSGRGLHVYWPLTEEVPKDRWKHVADHFRDLCIRHNMYVDTQVFEAARVLRVPGTYNFKDTPPTMVEVLYTSKPMEFSEFSDLIGTPEFVAPKPKRELTALGKAMLSNVESSFKKIMIRSEKGTGCAQLWDCYLNRTTLSEPRWFSALSIAKFCSDRDTAIHKLSQGYEDYSPQVVENKLKHIEGPHSCAVFEKGNPGGCDGCSHKGNITSPIALGKEMAPLTEEDNIVTEEAEDTDPVIHKIPDYPEPFYRGKNGGIYYMPSGDEAEPVHVYEHDLYVLKRMEDPVHGGVVVMKLHLPRDGVKQFVVTNVQASDKSELRKVLAKQGVMCSDKKFVLLTMYLHTVIRDLQFKRKAEMMRSQFGWCENNSKFIIGDREISTQGIYHSPPSSATADIAEKMQPRGTLDKWKEVFDLYSRPGLEAHAFAALCGFGSPLFKFLGYKGCIVNLVHSSSGTGKSTCLFMANSIFGDPEGLACSKRDTMVAKITILGIMNNILYTVDEMTEAHPKEITELAYSITQGKGKERGKANVNELRKNLTTWSLMALCSSNTSFYEKLAYSKDSPRGEFMRLIEYKVDYVNEATISIEEAKAMFDHQLKENYGWAGDIYMEYIVNNLDEVRQKVLELQKKLDRELRVTPGERFWTATVAVNLIGGIIAERLGLITWDMKAIYQWSVKLIRDLRQDVAPPALNIASVLGEYMNLHQMNVLSVDYGIDKRSQMATLPHVLPHGELLIRHEPDTQRLFFSAGPFKKYCVENQINYKDTLAELKQKGVYLGASTKRLSRGMKIAGSGVHCLEFDCSKDDFLDVDTIIAEGGADGIGKG